MLISYRWLGRHIDLEGLSPQDVVDSYMTHTAEVEGLEPFAPHLSAVTVGHVDARSCPGWKDRDHGRPLRGDQGAARRVLPLRVRQPRRSAQICGDDSRGIG